MRAAPVEQLLEAAAKTLAPSGVPGGLGVDIDGWILPRSPAEVFASGKQLPAELIIGINAREFSGPPDPAVVKTMIEAGYGKLSERALSFYRLTTFPNGTVTQAKPDPLYGDAGAQWMTDTSFRCPSMVVADWNSKTRRSTYQYQFDRGIPGHPEMGAVHASEVAYVFASLDDYTQ